MKNFNKYTKSNNIPLRRDSTKLLHNGQYKRLTKDMIRAFGESQQILNYC